MKRAAKLISSNVNILELFLGSLSLCLYYLQVLGRVMRQLKQERRGLKETPMWELATQRPDSVDLLFPPEAAISPQVDFHNLSRNVASVVNIMHRQTASITVCHRLNPYMSFLHYF